MLKLNLQSGGGMHSEYCPLCELAYEELPEIDDDDYDDDDDDDDDDDNAERKENPLKKLANIDLKWLQNGLGFDRETKTILPVEGDDMYGQFPIKGRRDESFTAEMYGEGEFGWGPVFHTSPQGSQTKERILRKIDGWLSKQKRVASPIGRKQLQREDAVKALERARADLKQALSKVDELKQEVAAREAAVAALSSPSPASSAASPKGGPTKKRALKKRAPKPAATASVSSSSCASHKTKETCPPNECVWGKTNRCSKKRKA